MNDTTLKDLIKSDYHIFFAEFSYLQFIKLYLTSPSFRYTVWLRVWMYYKKQRRVMPLKILIWLIYNHYANKFRVHISTDATIGKGLKIVHADQVYINVKEIGDNFVVLHGVTIGANHNHHSSEIPSIGHNVFVGVGAVIFGDITVGNNVMVGANSVITKNIPDNAVVAGIPARLIRTLDAPPSTPKGSATRVQ